MCCCCLSKGCNPHKMHHLISVACGVPVVPDPLYLSSFSDTSEIHWFQSQSVSEERRLDSHLLSIIISEQVIFINNSVLSQPYCLDIWDLFNEMVGFKYFQRKAFKIQSICLQDKRSRFVIQILCPLTRNTLCDL